MTIQHVIVKLSESCNRALLNNKLTIFSRLHVLGDTICYNGTLDEAEDLLDICRESDPHCEIELHSETF